MAVAVLLHCLHFVTGGAAFAAAVMESVIKRSAVFVLRCFKSRVKS